MGPRPTTRIPASLLNPMNNRREFLKTASSATLAALAAGVPQQAIGSAPRSKWPEAKADSIIILWMGGGMAAPDTFDPKRYVPFEVGVPLEKVISTFPAH